MNNINILACTRISKVVFVSGFVAVETLLLGVGVDVDVDQTANDLVQLVGEGRVRESLDDPTTAVLSQSSRKRSANGAMFS